MNSDVKKDINELQKYSPHNKIDPILKIYKDQTNPFLPKKIADFAKVHLKEINTENIYFCKQLQISSDIPDVKKVEFDLKNEKNDKKISPEDFFHSHNAKDTLEKNFHLSLRFNSLITNLEIIEPFRCSVFLYSKKLKRIISDSWCFQVQNDSEFVNNSTFLIDKSQYDDTYIIFILSHPLNVQSPSIITKYYKNPNPTTLAAAKKSIINNDDEIYSQFCWSFLKVSLIQTDLIKKIMTKEFFLLDKAINESSIFTNIETPFSELKPINLSLSFIKTSMTNNINNPIPRFNLTPYLYPLHQLSLRINSANVSSKKAKNILIEASFRESPQSKKQRRILDPYNSEKIIDTVQTTCVYNSSTPTFNSNFVIELPFPIQGNYFICFEIFQIKTESTAKNTKNLIGTCSIDVFDNNGLAKTYDNENIPITFVNSTVSSNSFINASLELRSTFITENESFKKLKLTKDFKKYFKLVPDTIVLTNLMEIIDIFIFNFSRDKVTIDDLFSVKGIIDRLGISPELLERYFTIYADFFAIRNNFPFRGFHEVKDISQSEINFAKPIESTSPRGAKKQRRMISDSAGLEKPELNEAITKMTRRGAFSYGSNSSSEELYMKLISAMKEYLKSNSIADISIFVNFILTLIIKSMIVSPTVKFDDFNNFCSVMASSITKSNDYLSCISFGMFALMLFDIEFAEESSTVVVTMIDSLIDHSNDLLEVFLETIIQPIQFLMWIKYSEPFRIRIMKIIKMCVESSKITNNAIQKILHCSTLCSKMMNSVIASNLIPVLSDLSFNQRNVSQPILRLFLYIVSNASKQYMKKVGVKKLIKYVNLIINNVNDTSNKYYSYIINFIVKAIYISEKEDVKEILELIYHVMVLLIDVTLTSYICSMLSIFFKQFEDSVFYVTKPPVAKIIYRVLRMACAISDEKVASYVAKPFTSLFETEFSTFKSNDMSIIVSIRALSLLTDEELTNNSLIILFKALKESKNESLVNLVDFYTLLRDNSFDLLKANRSYEEKCFLTFKKFKLFCRCPDAQLEVLNSILKMNLEKDNRMEYISTLLLKSALIVEYSTINGNLPNVFDRVHPSNTLLNVCPFVSFCNAKKMLYKKAINPRIVATSTEFTPFCLLKTLQECMSYCIKNNMNSTAFAIIDFIWPIIEYNRLYNVCSSFFNRMAQISEEIGEKESEIVDDYFRVKFIGKIFGDENGKEYVYHLNKETKVFDFSNQLIAEYSRLYGRRVYSYQSAVCCLDPTCGYISVMHVKPYKPEKNEAIGSISLSKRFYFDTPFVPGSKNPQGTVETQWIKRTIVETKEAMPCLLCRIETKKEEKKVKEYEPIKVALRQIQQRTRIINDSIKENDYQQVQQLLHGSLLTQVNEGPRKTAEVFLSKEGPVRDKLKVAFMEFIDANERGVKLHSEWAAQNIVFEPLQEMLELGLEELKDKISSLC